MATIMLQQRKLAWTERKKKPKGDLAAGKCGANSGKVSSASRFHKTRHHEGGKMAYCQGTSSVFVLKGPPGGGKPLRKCSLATTPFLPPIKAMTVQSGLSLKAKEPDFYGEATDGAAWATEDFSKTLDKESLQKELLSAGSSQRCLLSQSVNLPLSWEAKPFVVKDFMRPPPDKAPTPDLYKSCLLVLSSRRDGGRESKAYHKAPETFRSSAERSLVSRTTRRDLSTWRSTSRPKLGEKQSSGDSAFGTDSCSETVEVDLELGLEMSNLEMDHYTQQRIITWILQVNAALFSPTADSVHCPLTEQDTSIKIVYDGD